MELWQLLLAISIFFAILTFSYPLVMRIRRKRREEREEERIKEKEMRREEEVMKILRDIEELKENIERGGMKLQ
jgi:flagellar biosynthesis/type III secretory pathway M-ring protein FliF/YscJ